MFSHECHRTIDASIGEFQMHTKVTLSSLRLNGRSCFSCLFHAALLLTLPVVASGQLNLNSVFSDHAVLQRDSTVPIWGTASIGADVTVKFSGQTVRTKATQDGTWRLELAAMKANATPQALVATAGQDSQEINNVLIGDVWLGSGQSNMAGSVSGYAKNDHTLKAVMDKAPYPNIRLMFGGPKPKWVQADQSSVPKFSALHFAFGERLHRDLDVPVGLIVGAVGGTPSGSWIPAETFANSQKCKSVIAEFSKTWDFDALLKLHDEKLLAWEREVAAAKKENRKPQGRAPRKPFRAGESTRGPIGNLYARYIASVAGYRIRGVLWDQGEARSGVVGVDQFTMMTELIRGWREAWGQGDFPFLFVQKPSGGGCAFSKDDPITRVASEFSERLPGAQQIGAANVDRHLYVQLMLDNKSAWMVPAADLGGNIHPSNKWGYGNRAAQVALFNVYNLGSDAYGPIYDSHVAQGGTITVRYSHVGGGLVAAHNEKLLGFALAGADGKWYWAQAKIAKDTVEVSCAEVPEPKKVSYALLRSNLQFANLFSKEGLRALSFEAGE
jgi:sialate O-acetylesterase